jgi:hypothetical protein
MTGLRGRIICGTAPANLPAYSNFLSFQAGLAPFILDRARCRWDRSIVGPQFGSHVFNQNAQWEPYMKRLVLGSAIFLTFAPAIALAQGRGSDAALGAVSGAVVFGPVGALAGAVVGYTAGPSIAHSWGLRRSGSKRIARERSRAGPSTSRISQNLPPTAASPEQSGTVGAAPAKPAPAAVRRGAAPPVQGLE